MNSSFYLRGGRDFPRIGRFLSNSALEPGVSVPEMDHVAVEWDFTVDSGKLRGG
jgi:hypothetical protein